MCIIVCMYTYVCTHTGMHAYSTLVSLEQILQTQESWSWPTNIIQGLFFFNLFILFLAVLGLCCCTWAFSSCGERGLLSVAMHRLLIAVASLVVEHGV